ncbi:Phosphatidylethanolamine N-methyltransferase/Methylene-fatty-acyl-phospholipid synthase [Cynara cardunculus var. scolymus]|uniref:phosphatidyl-N-methylethanolamine N-methyltransferase n=1 Tax=Cynara cardunculus var. scolymus TaxID=59895 RepID=A0A103XYB1_CYNCS|nr:Phosphatidylethanolamine N-methyltransferase/Methylene-fatty-acyl-phospholipid synthase [Cynara cardunculus var. scolymus]
MGILACFGVVTPFPFYYWLWNHPQTWVNLCGKGRDPCKIMAMVSHFLKLVQFLSLFSVSTFSWPPPLYFWPLFLLGQFLNLRVYQLLGESGTYYGVRFGKNIPWVTEFPFGTVKDPQYVRKKQFRFLFRTEQCHTDMSIQEPVSLYCSGVL